MIGPFGDKPFYVNVDPLVQDIALEGLFLGIVSHLASPSLECYGDQCEPFGKIGSLSVVIDAKNGRKAR